MKKVTSILCGILFLLVTTSLANASLITIGTAGYDGADYKLIWDNDDDLVWLDYTKEVSYVSWNFFAQWAENLESSLTINLLDGYTIDWDDNSWRLPTTVPGPYEYGYDGTTTGGYNITTSELGHLYYEELGNLGLLDTSGNSQPGYGLNNTGRFDNLDAHKSYWSGTPGTVPYHHVWSFDMGMGEQYTIWEDAEYHVGMALRSGQVLVNPEPGTFLLVAAGLIGVCALSRRKKSRV